MPVELVEDASPELESAFAKLIPQLSRSSAPMNIEQLEDFLAQDNIYLFVYRGEKGDDERGVATGSEHDVTSGSEGGDGVVAPILGMLTLVTFEIPTGWRAWIEDVVVDEAARGQGAGQKLVEAAIDLAQKKGVKSVDLTSRPSREAANRLYRRAGFTQRETNVYRYNG
ncbi:ribosomal protein S18 acetylase RimI-like enzyme [Arcanobacterium pluranimalium]|uniref:GNAT family N-acetyltransferase n=1 Tax=Arcanobacterium pluranimalium TaxID=108028 RepID=UPI0019569E7E|nr:GNAT family N-acetyltransferase [Arcanobacterium pluranimalium]MBM7825017.1 ribosomal protein S18 acetylase RimI-like enzyme [Arcanobacterium pluranimalium]